MQFYNKSKILYRKAVTPITFMTILHGNTRMTINLNIPAVGIALLTFPLVGAIYLCSMIPDVIRYQGIEKQVREYSQEVSDLNATLLSLKKAEKEIHALISLGAKEKILERVDTSDMGSFDISKIQQHIESSVQTLGAIKDYLRTQKDQKKIILFNIKAADVIKYDQIISKASRKHKVDAALIKAIIKTESNFNYRAISPNGAQGLMQLMPQTAHALQIEDSFHPENNIEGGTRYIKYLLNLFEGNLALALAAYNAGESTVIKYNKKIPPYRETQAYVQRVLDNLNSYRRTDGGFKH